ncbi:flocculation protein FLO11-like [Homalodisca vitripennis]|uniref:flocculation protein FLO11-like n=1 Tax=Homalodisca vitripennis TaxID=197043 RepID=UPI001EEB6A6B|nr:flocculation protein FLO11-like [Homalodisca vitripennis]
MPRCPVFMGFSPPVNYAHALHLGRILFPLARGDTFIEQKLGDIMVKHLLQLAGGSNSQVQHRRQRGGKTGRKEHRAQRPRHRQERQDLGPPQLMQTQTTSFTRPQDTITSNTNSSTVSNFTLPSSRDPYRSQQPAVWQQQFPQPPPYTFTTNQNYPYSQAYGQTRQNMMPPPSPNQSGKSVTRASHFNSNSSSPIAQENTASASSGGGFHRPWNCQGMISSVSAGNNRATSSTSFQPISGHGFPPNYPQTPQVQESNNSNHFPAPFARHMYAQASCPQPQPSQTTYPYSWNDSQMFQNQSAPTQLIHHLPNNGLYPDLVETMLFRPPPPPTPTPIPTPNIPSTYSPFVPQPSTSFWPNEQTVYPQQPQAGPQYPYSGNSTAPLPCPTNSYSSAAENSAVSRQGPACSENAFSNMPLNQYTNVNDGTYTMSSQANASLTTVKNKDGMLAKQHRKRDQTKSYTYPSQSVHQVPNVTVNQSRPYTLVNVEIEDTLKSQEPSMSSENNDWQASTSAERPIESNQQGLSDNEYQFAAISPDSDRLSIDDSVIYCPSDLTTILEPMPAPIIKVENQEEVDLLVLENIPVVEIELPNEVLEFMKERDPYS